MTTREPDADEVRRAAAEIVDAFAATDGERYFTGFSPDATFLFHTEPARLDDRASYERLWGEWVESGWRVRSCESSGSHVQTYPGGAVFSHDVATSVDTGDGGVESYRERETIVFRVADTGAADGADARALIAVHEHLSPAPA
ncbi:nuclear transport factor 2 family protein [Agromyces intestinalis]|uniref:Nuclear transport factor 2 family protein n=1 Tax=Agromyces intestinalis TaxID=2592652 RepID=A0A5C1YDX9_9MICO|nr:nuclear transport factor 2 family protein [Agromyces intestinalis]QEO13858.1 nuclear transport factor 2 family protein [Agromyces intestinalis]